MLKWLDDAPSHLVETVESLKHMQSSWFTKRFYAAINDEDRKWIDEAGLNKRQLYWLVHHPEIDEIPKCPICGKIVHFECGKTYCSNSCSRQDPAMREKIIASNMERYGTPYPLMSEAIKTKAKQTCLEKYGVEYSMQADCVKEKAKATNREKLGCDWVVQSSEKMEMAKATNRKKLGCDWAMQSNEVLAKAKKSMLKKYGVERPLQSKQCVSKMKETMVERYGSVSAFDNEELALKAKISSRNVNWQRNRDSLLKHKNIKLLTSLEDYSKIDVFQYKCLTCGTIFESEGTNYHQVFCPKCSFYNGSSRNEKEVLSYIHSIYSGEVIENTRKIIAPKELDIYIPEKKLAIEFNGLYWHSSAQKPKDYHIQKTLACREKGIRLIHIFEWEWLNKRPICEALLRNALGVHSRRIGARKCDIFEISSETYRMFLEEFHLQGAVNSPMRLGLFYDGELLAVAGWGKSRFRKEEMELHRFCIKADVSIPGALSRLCSHSGLESFISYVDLSHFNGTGYVNAGFKEIGISSPGYCWCRGPEILSRLQTQKHRLPELLGDDFDPELTEAENMELAGWMQSFDCGNLKMEWQKKS